MQWNQKQWNCAALILGLGFSSATLFASLKPFQQDRHITAINEIVGDQSLVSSQQRPFKLFVQPVHQEQMRLRSNSPIYFLVQGGLHGNEILTSQFVNWLSQRVQQGRSPLNRLPPQVVIDFLPYANPDAYAKSRYNPHNVNLNRNFSVLWGLSAEPNGKAAFSEPESRAIRALMERRRYLAAIDVHGYVNWVVAPSTPRAVKENNAGQMDRYLKWIKAIQQNMSDLGQYELQTPSELGDGGAFEDWAFWKNQTFAACLEMEARQRHIQNGAGEDVDMFERYENFIFNMFSSALAIEKVSTNS